MKEALPPFLAVREPGQDHTGQDRVMKPPSKLAGVLS